MQESFAIPLFDGEVWLITSKSVQESAEKFCREHKGELDKDYSDALALTVWVPSHGPTYAIILSDEARMDYDTIAHEVFHLVGFICKYYNVKFEGTSETCACLMGNLTNEIIARLKKSGYRLKLNKT
jgi:hypothetical protein